MPILVLTTTGRKSGQSRSTPVGYLEHGDGFAILASNAGNDRSPAWWLNLQADPNGEVLADRVRNAIRARRADAAEEKALGEEFRDFRGGPEREDPSPESVAPHRDAARLGREWKTTFPITVELETIRLHETGRNTFELPMKEYALN